MRDRIFCRDWTNDLDHRLRWMIVPAESYLPAQSNQIAYGTLRPEWNDQNADVPAGSKYVRIPDNTVFVMGDAECAFDARPHGVPEPSIVTAGVNMTRLEEYPDTNALHYLPAYLLYPQSGEVFLHMDGAGTESVFVPACNVWTLVSDEGDPDLPIEDFVVLFQGVQVPRLEVELKLRTTAARARIDVELVEITKYVTQCVTAYHIDRLFRKVFGNDSAVYEPDWNNGASGAFYDSLWRTGGMNYARIIRSYREGHETPFDEARYYKFTKLWEIIGRLCDNAYHSLLRQPYTVGNRKFTFRYTGNTAIVDATPLEHITWHKQTYATGNGAGAALARDQVYFNGYIWRSNAASSWSVANAHSEIDQTKFIGGFLCPKSGPNSLFNEKWANVWDLLTTVTRSLIKVQWDHIGETQTTVWFARMNDNVHGRRPVARRDFQVAATEDIVPVMGAMVVAGAIAETEGGESDESSFPYKISGYNMAEEDEDITCVWHNLPKYGDSDNRYQCGTDDEEGNYIPDLVQPFIAGASEAYNPLVLCYFDTPAGIATQSLPIKVADQVGIDLGYGTVYYDGATVAHHWEYGGVTYYSDAEYPISPSAFDNVWWLGVRAQMKQRQRTSCLPFSLATRAGKYFSNTKQLHFSNAMRHGKIRLETVGDIVEFCDDDGVYVGCGIFLDAESPLLDSLPGKAHILATNINFHTATTEAELLAIPAPGV